LYFAGISLLGGEIFGVSEQIDPKKRQMGEKHLLGGQFLTPNCVFQAIVREIISVRLACASAQEKTKCRKAVRKKSQEVCISRMCGVTPSGRI